MNFGIYPYVTSRFTRIWNYIWSGKQAIVIDIGASAYGYNQLARGGNTSSATTGVDFVLSPPTLSSKITYTGQGALIYGPPPDGSTYGGNARGANAIDISMGRSAATQVASGAQSIVLGYRSGCSNPNSICIGNNVVNTNTDSAGGNTSIGYNITANQRWGVDIGYTINTGTNTAGVYIGYSITGGSNYNVGIGTTITSNNWGTVAIGNTCTANAYYSVAIGDTATADAQGGVAIGRRATVAGSSRFAFAQGDTGTAVAIMFLYVLQRQTTDATANVVLTADRGTPTTVNIPMLANNSAQAFHGRVIAMKSDGSAAAAWDVSGLIRRDDNAGSTVLVANTVTAIDTAELPGVTVALSADTTNGALQVAATGLAATTINWYAYINAIRAT